MVNTLSYYDEAERVWWPTDDAVWFHYISIWELSRMLGFANRVVFCLFSSLG